MKLYVLMTAAAVTLAGCTSEQSAAEAMVRRGLKDPDSAKFGEFYHNKETKKACLTVNARNSMGGYSGNVQFELRRDEDGWTYVNEVDEISPADCRELYADRKD